MNKHRFSPQSVQDVAKMSEEFTKTVEMLEEMTGRIIMLLDFGGNPERELLPILEKSKNLLQELHQ